jgi:uncharacterized membrane protein
MKLFSKGEAIKFGWTTVIGNLGLFIVAILIVWLMSAFPAIFDSWIVYLVSWLFAMVVTLGVMRMSLRFVDDERGELVDLFAKIPLIIPYLIASIVVAVIVMVGFILLIIPGIYLALRLQFFGWAIVDKDLGPFAAIQESWEMTQGSAWNLFLLWWLLLFVNVAGMLALGIGLLVTSPLTLVAMAYVYRKLERSIE